MTVTNLVRSPGQRAPLAFFLLSSGGAVCLWLVAVLEVLATVLAPSCGNDAAWVAIVAAALLATVAAIMSLVAVILRWRSQKLSHRGFLVAIAVVGAMSVSLVVVSLFLSSGACP